MNSAGPKMRKSDKLKTLFVRTFIDNTETCLFGIAAFYITLISLFRRELISPLVEQRSESVPLKALPKLDSLEDDGDATAAILSEIANDTSAAHAATRRFVFPLAGIGGVDWRDDVAVGGVEQPARYVNTLLSLFALWTLSQALGYASTQLRLPPLVGMLASGIIFVNLPSIFQHAPLLTIHKSWATFARQIAFILCVVRSGIGLDPEGLRRCWKACTSLAILSATAEAAAVFVVGDFVYGLHFGVAILFAYIMAANSPAVTIPLMLDLQAARRGTAKRIPTILLTGVAVDNVYCVMAYFAVSASVFTGQKNDGDSSQLARTIATVAFVGFQLVLGVFVGILTGYVLRYFPRVHPPAKGTTAEAAEEPHFARALLLGTTCCALFFGAYALHFDVAAPASVFAASIAAASGWKRDNRKRTRVEERVFKRLWDLIFLPLLFALTGALFHLSLFSWSLVGKAMATLCIGLVARLFSAFGIAQFCSNLNLKERIFLAVSFTPKATVQAVFLPFLVTLIIDEGGDEATARYVACSCALSILVAAPVAHFVIDWLGKLLLTHDDDSTHHHRRHGSSSGHRHGKLAPADKSPPPLSTAVENGTTHDGDATFVEMALRSSSV